MPYLHGKLEHPLSTQLTAEVHVYYATGSEVEAGYTCVPHHIIIPVCIPIRC